MQDLAARFLWRALDLAIDAVEWWMGLNEPPKDDGWRDE